LAATLEKKPSIVMTSASQQPKPLNAESVTTIATNFLKRIGNKSHLKPKRVSLEEGIFTVEVEMNKLSAIIRVESETHEIRSYEIQPKGEEAPSFSMSPRTLLMIFGISAAVYVLLNFGLRMIGF
jgi:hypothetical protein